jgi:uncharacterized membrane protein SirB2
MPSFLLLKTLHLIGVFLTLIGVAGLAAHAANGAAKRDNAVYGLLAGLHGTGLLLVLLCGGGMLMQLLRTPGGPSPAWMTTKLVIWILFAGTAAVPYRWPRLARGLLAVGLPVLGALAVVVAVLKPY